MKNWKTTLGGVLVASYPFITALSNAYEAGYFTTLEGFKLIGGVIIIIMGVLAKDPK